MNFIRAVVALALLGAAANARAQNVFFPDDATINSAVSGNAILGYANQSDLNNGANPTSPTVSLVPGGSVSGQVASENHSLFIMTGGSTGGTVATFQSGTANISGGTIHGNANGNTSGILNITGGIITGGINTFQNGVANVSGGAFSGLSAANNSILNFSGGTLNGSILLFNNAALNISGFGLSDTLTNPNASNGVYSLYTLFGTLKDGTSIDGKQLRVQNGSHASFNFINAAAVPEPGSIALLVGMTSVGMGVLRKRRHH